MLPFDLVCTVVFIGVFHLGIGMLIGRNLNRKDEPLRQPLWWGLQGANADLTVQLNSLAQLRERLASTPTSDLTEQFNSLIEQITQIVKRSQETLIAAEARKPGAASRTDCDGSVPSPRHVALEEPTESQTAALDREKWFPATTHEVQHEGAEKRKSRRFPYVHRQYIAPTLDGEFPDTLSFVQVLFRDISRDGFSFYSAEEFPADRLVAKLGSPPDIVPVLARVIHQKEVWHDGAWVYCVGCEIVRRLDREKQHPQGVQPHHPHHTATQGQFVS